MKKFTFLLLFLSFQLLVIDCCHAQIPVANFIASDSSFCANGCINFTDLSTNTTSWQWSFAGSLPSSSTDQNPQGICYLNPGNYSVTLIAINGVNRDTLTKTNYVNVHPSPPTPFIMQSLDSLVCSTDPSYVSYQWYDSTTLIQGATNFFYLTSHSGNYNVQVGNAFGCKVAVGLNVIVLPGNDTVKGTCFIDYNKNGVQDNGEPPYRHLLVTTTGNGKTWSTQPDAQGYFVNYADSGTITTILENVSPAYSYTPSQHTSVFHSSYSVDSVNFALVPIPGIRDLQITLVDLSRQRVGMNVVYHIEYTNAGTDTVPTGSVLLIPDSHLVFVSSIPNYDAVNGDTLIWNYVNLMPNETRSIDVTFYIPTSVYGHEVLTSYAIIEPVTPNAVGQDSYATLADQAYTSHDPNDKAVLSGDSVTTKEIADGKYLTYMIRFQNTGNDTAFKIVILDTLDNNLDAATLEVVSASGKYVLKADHSNNLTFTFDNVLLPDSNVNEPASNGYICYRAKPKSSLAPGTVINNKAYIYFDFNAAVPTNIAVAHVAIVTGLDAELLNSDFRLFPNPAHDILTVHASSFYNHETASVSLKNVLGQEASRPIQLKEGNVDIDISGLSAGMYFLQIKWESGYVVKKFVKE